MSSTEQSMLVSPHDVVLPQDDRAKDGNDDVEEPKIRLMIDKM